MNKEALRQMFLNISFGISLFFIDWISINCSAYFSIDRRQNGKCILLQVTMYFYT